MELVMMICDCILYMMIMMMMVICAHVGQRRYAALKSTCDATPIWIQQDFPELSWPTFLCEKTVLRTSCYFQMGLCDNSKFLHVITFWQVITSGTSENSDISKPCENRLSSEICETSWSGTAWTLDTYQKVWKVTNEIVPNKWVGKCDKDSQSINK